MPDTTMRIPNVIPEVDPVAEKVRSSTRCKPHDIEFAFAVTLSYVRQMDTIGSMNKVAVSLPKVCTLLFF